MPKLKDILQSFPISAEDANDLISRFETLKEDQRAFLENNPGKFRSIEKIEAYITEREDVGKKKKYIKIETTSSITEKSYSAFDSTVSLLKIIFWIVLVVIFFIGGMITQFNFIFWVSAIPAGLLALLIYAQLQLLEALVDTAKNTNKTNTLLDINNQLLQILIKQKK